MERDLIYWMGVVGVFLQILTGFWALDIPVVWSVGAVISLPMTVRAFRMMLS